MARPYELKYSSLEIKDKGGLEISQNLDPEALASLGVEAELAGPVALKADFSVGGKELLLLGTARGAFLGTCSRCLGSAKTEFEGQLEQTYDASLPEVNIGDEVREAVMIELPDKPLCRPDCKGLCPRCGKNLNEGPCGCSIEKPGPFAKLKELKKEKRK